MIVSCRERSSAGADSIARTRTEAGCVPGLARFDIDGASGVFEPFGKFLPDCNRVTHMQDVPAGDVTEAPCMSEGD